MSNFKYIYIPVSTLEENQISKESAFQNSTKFQNFLKTFLNETVPFSEITNVFFANNCFIFVVKNKTNIKFENASTFYDFKSFINTTPFANKIEIDDKKREISILSDIPPIFYNLLYEFLV